MRQTVSTLEIICGAIALLIGGVLFFGSDWVARHWITKTTLSPSVVVCCLSWMGLQVAFQFMTSFYNSGLLGLQKIVLSNILQAILQTIRAACVIALLMTTPRSAPPPVMPRQISARPHGCGPGMRRKTRALMTAILA